MTLRWFRLLVRTFPASIRDTRGVEIVDALEESDPSTTRVIGESASLLWASSVAWRRYLRTTTGVRRSALFGACLWLGVLLGLGPALRLRLMGFHGADALGWETQLVPVVASIALFTMALVVLTRSRGGAALLGIGAVVAAGDANTVGPWGLPDAVWYEIRWIGLALAVVVMLATFAPRPRWQVVAVPIVFATVLAFLPLSPWSWGTARSYNFMLRYELLARFGDYVATSPLEWAFAAAFVVALLVPFFVPAVAAMLAPAAVHLLVLDPRSGLVLVLYAAALVGWHCLRPRITIDLRWKPDPG